ncbi:MAG: HAMP domain-containing sensor histidine kinase [Cyanobacteria bacterium J06597_16]
MNALFSRLSQPSRGYLMPVLMAAITLSLVLLTVGSFSTSNISNSFRNGLTTDFQLQRISGNITYLEEVLTMSSRMAAATGDLSWEARYQAYEPLLVETINEAIALAPEAYDIHARQIDEANLKLIAMETEAFELVRNKNAKQALSLLFSDSYNTQKERYATGIQLWTELLDNQVQSDFDRYGKRLFWAGVFSMTSLWTLVIAWIILLWLINQQVRRQTVTEQTLHRTAEQLEADRQRLQHTQHTLQTQETALSATLQSLQQTQQQIVQSEKMTSLGQLVAGVAQELNRLLHVMDHHLTPLKQEMMAPQQVNSPESPEPAIAADIPKRLTALESSTERVHQIVRSLQNVSRTDEATSETIDIHEPIESTLLVLQHRLNAANDQSAIKQSINIVRDYATIPPVECFPGPLNQVFITLIANAIDAIEAADRERARKNTSKGANQETSQAHKITISTQTFTDTFDVQWVKIAVTDTGTGIPEDYQQRVFNAFFTNKPIGTGVSLSNSYVIVTEKHNGRLTFSTTPNQGTTFTIQLPVDLKTEIKADTSQPNRSLSDQQSPAASSAPPHKDTARSDNSSPTIAPLKPQQTH